MGPRKVKIIQNKTVFGIIEGNTESTFVEYLINIYKPRNRNIVPRIKNAKGLHDPNLIVQNVINPKEGDFDKCFVWFDEDFEPDYPLSEETGLKLSKCWKINKQNIDNFLKCL